MTSTFAIDIIQALQTEETEQFRLFLESPYNTRGHNIENVRPFFEVLIKAVLKGDIQKIEKEDIYRLLFPDKPFIESKIDKLMSDLKRLLERFLLTQHYFSNENEARLLLDLAADLRQRGLESRYHQALEKTKKHADASGQESLKRLFFRYLLAKEEQEWQSTYNKGKGNLNIPETIHQLDAYYFAHRTWMLNHLMFMQKATSLSDPVEDIAKGILEMPQISVDGSAFLSICWNVHSLLKKDVCEVEDFQSLLKNIKLNEAWLSPESLSEFYAYLRNFCVILIDDGNAHLFPALHEINKDNLARGYFYLDGKISPNACLNITQIALNSLDTAWALSFIEAHKDRIINETEDREFYRMNKAVCLFGEKKYEEALAIIPFGSTYSAYHLMARRLELKIYYELRSDLLEHKIDAFKMFISRAGRKVFSAYLHELYTNFVNFVRQLNQSHGPQAKQRSQVLIKRIGEKKKVAERPWLLEKARELGEKR